MKKTLLMAVLMGIMSSTCVNAEVSDAQLLVHLKNIRKEVVAVFEDPLNEELGVSRNQLDYSQEVINEFYNIKSFQEIFNRQILYPQFAFICNNVGLSPEEILKKLDGLECEEFEAEVEQKLFEHFVPVFIKIHKKYSEKDKDNTLEKISTDDDIRSIYNNILDNLPRLGVFTDPFLKLIDAKIAELEAQIA